jgi:peptidoglycan/xylan/chitin deacetylase (PgdA/CDA1 family)
MTRTLPRFTASLIRAAGDGIASRAKGRGRLCILNYHRILSSPDPLLESEPHIDTFRWQMKLLAECFNVLPLHEAIQTLATERMPARAVAITFDDGYRSIHDLALPVLIEHALPATVFVTTGHMDEEGSMWNDMILEAVRRLPPAPLDLRELGLAEYPMASAEDRKRTAVLLTERCKYMPLASRAILTGRLQQLTGGTLRQDLMLNADMVRTLTQHRIDIGGHTVSHPILTRLDDEAANREILDNKRQLEAVTGQPVRLFAYPNGKRHADYDARHVQMVVDAGYDAAFTTETGAATRFHPRYEMPRSRPWDATPLMFAVRLLRWLYGNNS